MIHVLKIFFATSNVISVKALLQQWDLPLKENTSH